MSCKFCKHWQEKPEEPSLDAYTLSNLAASDETTYEPIVPQPFRIGICASPKLRKMERPECNGAAVQDGSGYFATLVTGEDFSCIHYDPGFVKRMSQP